jgi:hypothetical protein
MGNVGEAQNKLQQGLSDYERYDLPRRGTYYQTLCDFHELNGEVDKAIALREAQLHQAANQSIAAQSFAHLAYCRLLGRTGQSLDKALEDARAIAEQMKTNDLYLARVQRITDGNYYLYDWQKA